MLCDICHKKEAVMELRIDNGAKVEILHLCENCAEKKIAEVKSLTGGHAIIGPSDMDLTEILESMKKIFRTDEEIDDNGKKCPICGTSYDYLLKRRRVKCEGCYEFFKDDIEKFLFSIEKPTKHMGKTPANVDEEILKSRKERELMNKLTLAVNLEEYEEAAKLRDKIKALNEG